MSERKHGRGGSSNATLGWISGLGLAVVPWFLAGVVSTFTSDPESFFPTALTVAFVAMVGWIVLGAIRIPGFRRGALIGSTISLALVGALRLILLLVQP